MIRLYHHIPEVDSYNDQVFRDVLRDQFYSKIISQVPSGTQIPVIGTTDNEMEIMLNQYPIYVRKEFADFVLLHVELICMLCIDPPLEHSDKNYPIPNPQFLYWTRYHPIFKTIKECVLPFDKKMIILNSGANSSILRSIMKRLLTDKEYIEVSSWNDLGVDFK
jgi:hypothetical protein